MQDRSTGIGLAIIGQPFVFTEDDMDQQRDLNEHQELRDLLTEILKTQNRIVRQLD